jgi:NADP-dependent 3-hydroxy acid dehydrogenase YdfG
MSYQRSTARIYDDVFSLKPSDMARSGASAIGLALAAKCRGHDMKVMATDRDTELPRRASAGLGNGIITMGIDVSNLEDWARLKDNADHELGDKPVPSISRGLQ